MAADNRNFVNKFANEGGGDVLCEDKRFEELKSATAKTSSQISTSTDYIPLQDTDGNLVKINAASFQEAVRNTLGGLLANNDKGTTISGVPALSGSGASLDFGSVSPANLASALGESYFYNTNATSQSLDDLTVSNLYRVADGLLIVAKSQNRFVIQNHITYEGMSKIRYGIIESGSTTWYNWTPVGTFGCNTASDLASLLGADKMSGRAGYNFRFRGICRESSDDCNFLETGIYFVFGNCLNKPKENVSFIILSFTEGNNDVGDKFQMALSRENKLYTRTKGTNVNWDSWVEK